MTTATERTTRRVEPSEELPRKRWSTAEFDRLLNAGFLEEGSRTYLWDGEIIEPRSENPPHVNAVANLCRFLMLALPAESFTLNVNAPVELAEGYKPQPDLSILNGPRSAYRRRAPGPADLAMVVEVSDSTYAKDSGPFLRQYARAGIPTYWIVRIPERRVEVYSNPSGPNQTPSTYRQQKTYQLNDAIPLTLIVDGNAQDLGVVAVRTILEDSLEPTEEGGTH
ncbi:MAG: Uma2 family endonuclease [Isosphaeraceae bacterium]